MGPDISLLYPQKPATGSHPMSAKFILNCSHRIYLISILILYYTNIILRIDGSSNCSAPLSIFFYLSHDLVHTNIDDVSAYYTLLHTLLHFTYYDAPHYAVFAVIFLLPVYFFTIAQQPPPPPPAVDQGLLFDVIYLTAIGLPPGDSSTVHIYTQTVHRTT
jgi:hypothetical protein